MAALSKTPESQGSGTFLASVCASPTSPKLIVHGNATVTASNVAADESLFRLGIVSGLLAAA